MHLGHAALLEELCRGAERVLIGLGSPNRYNRRNPFTAAESGAMIRAVLEPEFFDTYRLIEVPDLGHGPRWRAQAVRMFGPLDLFVTANGYVRSLMEEHYPIAHPRDLVPVSRHVPIDGTMVRRALARGEPWEELVPPAVAELMRRNGLPERFRREFGLPTLIEEWETAFPEALPRG